MEIQTKLEDEVADEIEKCRLYLKHSGRGFIVFEVNEMPVEEFLISKLEALGDKLFLSISFSEFYEQFVMDSFDFGHAEGIFFRGFQEYGENIEELISRLNYLRDLIFPQNYIFIFFIPSFLVESLMKKTPSFWSFVSLHITIRSQIPISFQSEYSNGSVINYGKCFNENRMAFLQKIGKDLTYDSTKEEPKDELDKYNDLAASCIENGQFDLGFEYFKKIEEIGEDATSEQIVLFHYNYAVAFLKIGRMAEFYEYSELLKKEVNELSEGNALWYQCELLYNYGLLRKARYVRSQGENLKLLKRAENFFCVKDGFVAFANYVSSVMFFSINDLENAMYYCKRAEEILAGIGNQKELAILEVERLKTYILFFLNTRIWA